MNAGTRGNQNLQELRSGSPIEGSAHHEGKAIDATETRLAPGTLTSAEVGERDECENVIHRGWDTFLEVGRALVTIRDRRLYRDRYVTFEEYCRDKWEFSKTHANRLIEAAAVAAVLTPIGVKVKSESQLRALVPLAPHTILIAWRKAQELAGKGEVTARIIRRAAEEFRTDYRSRAARAAARAAATPPGMRMNSALRLLNKVERALKAKEHDELPVLVAKLRKCEMELAAAKTNPQRKGD